MLSNVFIKNLALITESEINFDNGLNILTGETGSGKSIIIGAINIGLGGKASKGLIRSGCDQALIELTFKTDDCRIHNILKEQDISDNGSSLVITRKITQDSSTVKINGETSNLTTVKDITSLLVDVHGQHDHQSLLDPLKHIDILDGFAAASVNPLKKAVIDEYNNYKKIRKELVAFSMDEKQLENEKSLLKGQLEEINSASLVEGEDEKLENVFKKMTSMQQISESVEKAIYSLNDDQNGAYSKLSSALSEITFAAKLAPNVAEIGTFKNTLADLESVAFELGHELDKFRENNSFDQEKFKKTQDRLNQINQLKSKYGNTISDVLKYAESLEEKLVGFENYSATRESLAKKLSESKSKLNKAANELSDARKSAAKKLESMISNELKELNFLNAVFQIDISKTEKISTNGFDRVEFLLSTNPGEQVKPLAKIASGGEISRIMLAIKTALAEKDEMPTLIFDEIDTGISGKTAYMVSRKLKALSNDHQIICITHLPQIAAMGNSHFSIHKGVSDGSTISGIEKLTKEQEIEELARLLSGAEITETSLQNARELKSQADKF